MHAPAREAFLPLYLPLPCPSRAKPKSSLDTVCNPVPTTIAYGTAVKAAVHSVYDKWTAPRPVLTPSSQLPPTPITPLPTPPPTPITHVLNPRAALSPALEKLLNRDPLSVATPLKRPRPSDTAFPDELGKLIQRDTYLLDNLGLEAFVDLRRGRSDFTSLRKLRHKARRLLRQYKHRGAPVVLSTPPWTTDRVEAALERGPHKSCAEHIAFLRDEFLGMINKGQWAVLPYSAVKDLPGLRLSPPGVIPQRDRRPRWIVDYTFSNLNNELLDIAPLDSMQFGRALERIIRHIVLADPTLGPTYLIKADVADGFYRVDLRTVDIPKLGVVFPHLEGEEPLVALPLRLPMGWKHSPPIFCAATETIADVANHALLRSHDQPPHRLESLADTAPPPLDRETPPSPPSPALPRSQEATTDRLTPTSPPSPALPQSQEAALPSAQEVTWSTLPHWQEVTPATLSSSPAAAVDVPLERDPSLRRSRPRRTAFVDVFVDDFVGGAQGNRDQLTRVRRILFHAIDSVFRPLDAEDTEHRQEPISVKKLLKGDCYWSTLKTVLGWIIDTVKMTIQLPQHRVDRLAEILASIPLHQKRISIKSWHKILGELRSMTIAIPGLRGMFSVMQEALRSKAKGRIALHKGVHDALRDMRWLQKDLAQRPTRLYELVPLTPSLEGDHDASGYGAGGVLLPKPHTVPRPAAAASASDPDQRPHPVLWRVPFPDDLVANLVSWKNPHGTVTNSDFELAGGLLHHEAAAQCYDIRERTLLSRTDNTPTLFWQRKGSTSTQGPASYLLRNQAIHQRYHRYVDRHDFLAGIKNPMADDASRLFDLSDSQLLAHFELHYPQSRSWRLFPLRSEMISSVTSALRRKTCEPASLLSAPQLPMATGLSGTSSALSWPSTPYSQISKTPSYSSRSSPSATGTAPLPPKETPSDLGPLRMPYGQLARRSRQWGPTTPGSTRSATSSSVSNANSLGTRRKTHRPTVSSLSPSR